MDELLLPVQRLLGPAWIVVWTLVKIIAITIPRIARRRRCAPEMADLM